MARRSSTTAARCPETTPYWSPRVGFNWDVTGDQATQVRGGTGLFSGKPPYVWISNQIGNTGVLYGFAQTRQHDRVPVQSESGQVQAGADRRRGGELRARRDRSRASASRRRGARNIGVDRRLPWGLVGTLDYIYNRDVNAPVYLNANLPAANSAYTGVDNRPRWVAHRHVAGMRRCRAGRRRASQRLNNAPGNQITAAYVIKNQSQNRSQNISGALTKNHDPRLLVQGRVQLRRVEEHRRASSTAGTSWGSGNPIVFDPNNPALAYSLQFAWQAHLPGGQLRAAVLRVRRDDLLGVLRRPHQRQHQLRLRG